MTTSTTRASAALDIPLTTELDHTAVQRLNQLGVREVIHAGVRVARQGFKAESVLLIERGWVGLTYLDDAGDVTLVAVCGAGCAIGDQAALAATEHQFGAVALSDVGGRRVDRSEFAGFARHVPGARGAVERIATRRLGTALGERSRFMRLSAVMRVARVLADLVRYDPDQQRWEMPFALRQDQLADLCCVGTRTIEKSLSELRRAAVIRTDGRPSRVVVDDLERLRVIAELWP